MKTVLVVIGTRPELIKLAPVVASLKARPDGLRVRVLFTGQHRDLLDQMAAFFGIQCDVDLQVMRPGQQLPELTARMVTGLDEVLAAETPDAVLAQGDTTSVLCAALACFYRRIPFGHVEAGLRTDTLFSPFPEEGNRRLVGRLATWHFAPTATARGRLLAEGIPDAAVFAVGNTIVDAIQSVAARDLPLPFPVPDGPLALVTLHRRESFGAPVRRVFGALRTLLAEHPDLTLVYPVHPNPNVRGPAHAALGDLPNARLVEPLGYGDFVALMKRATLLLSDSGGVQEEAPSLGVPLLVLRESTERPEGIEAGVALLVGTDPDVILREARRLLSDPDARAAMRSASNPYGDGHAADRIAAVVAAAMGKTE